MKPYFEANGCTLYHGDCRDVLAGLEFDDVDVVVTDPPYGETPLGWDHWPEGWPALVPGDQLWCFGSLKLLARRWSEFGAWKYAQDLVWEKHNGSGFCADRFFRVHEIVAHFYRGKWSELPLTQLRVPGQARPTAAIGSRGQTPHRGAIGSAGYEYTDSRLMRSVIQHRSCHGKAVHPTQKPTELLAILVRYSAPENGVVLDPFAGSGSTLVASQGEGRRAIGIEAEERYCEIAARRLSELSLLSAPRQHEDERDQ